MSMRSQALTIFSRQSGRTRQQSPHAEVIFAYPYLPLIDWATTCSHLQHVFGPITRDNPVVPRLVEEIRNWLSTNGRGHTKGVIVQLFYDSPVNCGIIARLLCSNGSNPPVGGYYKMLVPFEELNIPQGQAGLVRVA